MTKFGKIVFWRVRTTHQNGKIQKIVIMYVEKAISVTTTPNDIQLCTAS